MATEYRKSEEMRLLAEDVINEFEDFYDIKNSSCKIGFQTANCEKTSNGKMVYADTEKVKDKYRAFIPYDFLVTFYTGSTEELDEKRMKMLMYHELKHIGYDEESGKKYIVPHDLEDFRDVVSKWGVDWVMGDEQ